MKRLIPRKAAIAKLERELDKRIPEFQYAKAKFSLAAYRLSTAQTELGKAKKTRKKLFLYTAPRTKPMEIATIPSL